MFVLVEGPFNKHLCRTRLHLRSSTASKINNLLVAAPGEPVFVSIIPVLSKPLKEEDMNSSGPPPLVPTVVVAPYQAMGQPNAEMRHREYFSMMVAVVLAKARRDCDFTDDITNAVANCHITQQAGPVAGPVAGPSQQNNPFRSPQ